MCRSTLAIFSSVCVVSGAAVLLYGGTTDPPVVPSVDVKRYQGKWFEIARLPNSLQEKCMGDVTATYTLRPDKKIQVLNTCRERSGKMVKATATARPSETNGSLAKLKVTFFWPFSADYWIIELDPHYRWAVVGTPNRKYLWILSRTPDLPAQVYERLLARANTLGYNTSRIMKTRQRI